MASENTKHYGIYRGIVYSNKDPLNKRRLRLTIPAILGQGAPTEWAWPLETASVKVAVPALNQGVWVMFENGDPSYPIWAGTFGKVVNAEKHVLIKATTNSTGLQTTKFSDGRTEVDLVATLLDMAARIETLEEQMPIALQNGL